MMDSEQIDLPHYSNSDFCEPSHNTNVIASSQYSSLNVNGRVDGVGGIAVVKNTNRRAQHHWSGTQFVEDGPENPYYLRKKHNKYGSFDVQTKEGHGQPPLGKGNVRPMSDWRGDQVQDRNHATQAWESVVQQGPGTARPDLVNRTRIKPEASKLPRLRQEKTFKEAYRNSEVIVLDNDDDDAIKIEPQTTSSIGYINTAVEHMNHLEMHALHNKQKSKSMVRDVLNRGLQPHGSNYTHPGDGVKISDNVFAQAVSELSLQKESLEKKVKDGEHTIQLQKNQLESLKYQNAELQQGNTAQKTKITNISKRLNTLEKFLQGLGADYNSLNQQNAELNRKLAEVQAEKDDMNILLNTMRDNLGEQIKFSNLVKKSKITAEEALDGFEHQHNRIEMMEGEICEKVGLLAEERDRSRALQLQIQEEREKNFQILKALEDAKSHFDKSLAELVSPH
jgi:hypothetical protein